MVGLQTSHRYGSASMLASDFVLGIGNRWANRHTGSVDVYTKGRTFVHVDIEPAQIGPRLHARFRHASAMPRRPFRLFVQVARERKATGATKDFGAWAEQRCAERKRLIHHKTHYTRDPHQTGARVRGR